MPPAITHVLREAFAHHGLAAFIFERDGIHHDERGSRYAPYVRTWSPRLQLVEHALDARVWANDPLAAVALGEPAAVQAAHAAIRAHDATIFAVSFPVSQIPGSWALLVRAAGRNKGVALAEICAAHNCTLAEAVAVGDWVNDVPMFEVAGRSFAMGGTPDHVRLKATDTLDAQTGAGGGIAEAIKRAWG
jgi:hydroxymethylpyrimidine pyrophosphatase-like HAD family hydrolase